MPPPCPPSCPQASTRATFYLSASSLPSLLPSGINQGYFLPKRLLPAALPSGYWPLASKTRFSLPQAYGRLKALVVLMALKILACSIDHTLLLPQACKRCKCKMFEAACRVRTKENEVAPFRMGLRPFRMRLRPSEWGCALQNEVAPLRMGLLLRCLEPQSQTQALLLSKQPESSSQLKLFRQAPLRPHLSTRRFWIVSRNVSQRPTILIPSSRKPKLPGVSLHVTCSSTMSHRPTFSSEQLKRTITLQWAASLQ